MSEDKTQEAAADSAEAEQDVAESDGPDRERGQTQEQDVAESDGLMQAETLRGDIRDMVLREMERLPVIWADLPEFERNIVRDRVNAMASDIVYDAVAIVHAEGAPSMPMIVGKVAFGKGVSVSLTASRTDPNRHHLADLADGASVLLVMQNAARFLGERPKDEDEGEGAAS